LKKQRELKSRIYQRCGEGFTYGAEVAAGEDDALILATTIVVDRYARRAKRIAAGVGRG